MRKPIGRPKKEETWNQVTKEENGKWMCKYCGHQFSGKISVTRIRAHLNKETRQGTAPCSFDGDINEGAHNNLASGSIQVAEGVPERIEANPIISSSNNRDNNIDYGGIDDIWYPMLLNNQRDLYLRDNNQWICLCGALSSKAASSLNEIKVDNCKQLESVFCLSGSCFVCIDFCKLKRLYLRDLESLTVIYKVDVVDVRQSLSMRNKFPCLTYLHIYGCHEIKKLLTPWLVLQLPNLERITVSECNSMEEIIAVGNGGDNDGSSITLPKLTILELLDLSQLKTVCKGSTIFGSSPSYLVLRCPKLEWDHPAFPLKLDSFGSNF